MREFDFRFLFAIGPLMCCSLVPTALYGTLTGEWGTNLVWGNLFGLGWCVAAFVFGGLTHNGPAAAAGLIWGWLAVPPLLHIGSGWLWRRTGDRGRRVALALLTGSFLLAVPSNVIERCEEARIHLPDYTAHGAYSF